ncbi:MAG: hypothetical protein HND48_02585 [Chloroflexi bacterium]|nr:hypothetical protein [Chloroflexota bacterium]
MAVYLALGMGARAHRKRSTTQAAVITIALATVAVAIFHILNTSQGAGAAAEQSSLQFAATQTADGIVVDAIEPGGAAGWQDCCPAMSSRRCGVTRSRWRSSKARSRNPNPIRRFG